MVALATAFVRIEPETGDFRRTTERQATESGRAAGRQFGEQFTRDATGRLRSERGRFVRQGEETGRETGRRFGRSMASNMNMKSVVSGVLGAFAAIGGARVFAEFISEARESIRTGNMTAAVLKSTGMSAHVTAKQVGDLANALSMKVGVDDEAIQGAENLLLTFKDVRNETGAGNKIFDQATTAIVDMTAAMNHGTVDENGLKASTIQLGKALNDPVKGMTALTRVGVTFSQGQKDQIKSLVEHGNKLGAQKLILKEIQSEFGGAAAAAADPAQRMSVAWKNFEETVGLMLMPLLTKLANWLTGPGLTAMSGFVGRIRGISAAVSGVVGGPLGTFFNWIKGGSTWAGILRAALGGLVIGIVAVKVATTAWSIAQAILNGVLTANPIGLIVVAIAALAGGLIYAYKHSTAFRNIVQAVFRAVAAAGRWMWENALRPAFQGFKIILSNVIIPALRAYLAYVRFVFRSVATVAQWLWNTILKPAWNLMRWTLTNVLVPAFRTFANGARAAWNLVRSGISAGWSVIRGIFNAIRSALSVVRTSFSNAASGIGSAWKRIQSLTKAPVNFVIGTVFNRGIVGLWNKVMGWLHLPESLRVHTLPLLAQGGPLPAKPGLFNRPTAIVGEGRSQYPEYVIPTDPRYRGRARSLWAQAGGSLQMMADGGIIGFVKKVASKVANIGKTALSLITNPGSVWDTLVRQFVPSAEGLSTSPFGAGIAAIPKTILGRVKSYAMSIINAFKSGFGGGGNSGVVAAARKYLGVPYLWGGTGMGGIDCSGLVYRAWLDGAHRNVTRTTYTQRAYMNRIAGPKPGAAGQPHTGHTYMATRVQGGKTWVIEAQQTGTRVFEHLLTRSTPWWGYPPGAATGGIMSELGKMFVNGARGSMIAKWLGLAGDPGGVVKGYGPLKRPGAGLFDNGGMVGPGWPFHKSKPEMVVTGRQWNILAALATRGSRPSVTVNATALPNVPSESQIASAVDRTLIMHGSYWR